MDKLIIGLLVGASIGWIVSLVKGGERPLSSALIGAAGAGLGALLLTPLMGRPDVQGGAAVVLAIMVAVLGAETLLAAASLLHKGMTRRI